MTPIGEIWTELEAELATELGAPKAHGLLTRLATPEADQRLRVGIEWPSKARVLLFSARMSFLPARATWPECRGLELRLDVQSDGIATLVVRLRDSERKDVFTVLAEDLARRAGGASEADSARRVLAALGRWQKFLAAASRSLSDEARRGLWGELWALERVLVPAIGIDAAVSAWCGPSGAPQDFRHAGTAVEVKTRAARSPAVVRISGEQQLHEVPWQHLFLLHLAVDEQDGSGETLPQRVFKVRTLASATPVSEMLEDALLNAGWLEAESHKHQARGFLERQIDAFLVTDGFPRLTPPSLPAGVGCVAYELSLDAAEPHKRPVEEIRQALILHPHSNP